MNIVEPYAKLIKLDREGQEFLPESPQLASLPADANDEGGSPTDAPGNDPAIG